MSASKNYIYQQTISITHDYLGPAAERFIDRQVRSHLKKSPSNINEKDLRRLMDWIQAAFSLLTQDREVIEEYLTRLRKLSEH